MLAVVCVVSLLGLAAARGPPRILSEPQTERVRVAQLVRLHCVVDADPPALVQWTKDDEGIHSGWERVKVGPSSLRIRDVTVEDAGHYVCKATNGFGSVSLEHHLYVVADSNVTSNVGVEDRNGDGVKSEVAPQFVNPEAMEASVRQAEGSTVRLQCRAHGQPQPTVTWFHDDRPLPADDSQHPAWMLKLGDVGEKDNGRYTCRVSNKAGSISFTYMLHVTSSSAGAKPVISSPLPINTTVHQGDLATLYCTVVSEVEPTIQWLRHTDDSADIERNATFRFNGQSMVVLSRGVTQEMQPDGSFVSTLTLRDVTNADTGLYVCRASTSAGFSTQSAHLVVHKGSPVVNGNQLSVARNSVQLPVWVLVAVLLTVAALSALIVFFVVTRRQKSKRPPLHTNGSSSAAHNQPDGGHEQRSRNSARRHHDYARLQGPIYDYPSMPQSSYPPPPPPADMPPALPPFRQKSAEVTLPPMRMGAEMIQSTPMRMSADIVQPTLLAMRQQDTKVLSAATSRACLERPYDALHLQQLSGFQPFSSQQQHLSYHGNY